MTHPTRVPTVLLLVVVLSMAKAHAQPADPDSFQVWMQAAWKEVGQADFPDRLQRAYGWDFFRYYQHHPQTELGREAGWQAFLLWSNAKAVSAMDSAMAELPDDAELWSTILQYVSGAYGSSEERGAEALRALLLDLEGRLTHPASRSAVLFQLAQQAQREGRTEEARAHFQAVVDLDARPFFVDQALGALYEMASLNVGQQAPPFKATTVGGETIALSDLRGDLVLLEFWATWCGPCLPEIPHYKEMWSEYRDDGLQLIGISLDGSTETLRAFIEAEGITWPQIQQAEGYDDEIIKLYNVSGIPRVYLIGRDGTIVAKDFRKEEIETEVRQYMEGSNTGREHKPQPPRQPSSRHGPVPHDRRHGGRH